MKDTLDLIFIKYWSQIVLLLGIIGYLLKVFIEKVWLEPRNKTSEIQKSIFFKNKYERIEKVNDCVIKIYEITGRVLAHKIDRKNFDKELFIDFKKTFNFLTPEINRLQIYTNKKESDALRELLEKAELICKHIYIIEDHILNKYVSDSSVSKEDNETFHWSIVNLEKQNNDLRQNINTFHKIINKSYY